MFNGIGHHEQIWSQYTLTKIIPALEQAATPILKVCSMPGS